MSTPVTQVGAATIDYVALYLASHDGWDLELSRSVARKLAEHDLETFLGLVLLAQAETKTSMEMVN